MYVARLIIARAVLIASLLGVSLSGYAMAAGHGMDGHEAQSTVAMQGSGDLSHAHHDHDMHGHHGMSDGQDTSHDGHAACSMVACCHTGGHMAAPVMSPGDFAGMTYLSADRSALAEAAPERAKKPPRHI